MSHSKDYFKKIRIDRHISELPKSKLPASRAIDNGKYPFICSSADIKYTDVFLQNKPSVLMGTGGTASVNFCENEFSYSTDTWGFRSKDEEVHTEYLFRKVQQLLPQIDYAAFEGSGLKHLRKDYVRSLTVEVPKDLKISTKILEVLRAVDLAIEKTENLIEKQKLIKLGLTNDLLSNGIDSEGNLRQSRNLKPNLYFESSIGWLPVGWNALPLEKNLKNSPKNGYSPLEVDCWEGLYVLGLGCLTRQGFKPIQLKFAPRSASRSGAKLKNGDFLISRANTPDLVGLCGIYIDTMEETIYPDLMMRLSLTSDLRSDFLELYLLAPSTRVRLTALAVGTSSSMVKLNAKTIKNFLIAVPSVNEQLAIVEKMNPINELLKSLELQLLKLKWQRSGLLSDLLTGQTEVVVNEKGAATNV